MSTLNYIGSKKSLLHFLDFVVKIINEKIINKNITNRENNNLRNINFLDGFAGTGIVGKYFNDKYGYITHSNDLEYYSYIISYALLKVPYSGKLEDLINELDLLETPIDKEKYTLISKYYSEYGKNKKDDEDEEIIRKFWTSENALKADAIIENIQNKLDNEIITQEEYYFLLASLLSSFDKYANTASVYGAFLKKYKPCALKKYELKPIHTNLIIKNRKNNKIYNEDINSPTITNNNYDIAYLDLPYNSRQYSANYHPLNFISKYDSNIIPYGSTGLLKNSNKSFYSKKITANNKKADKNVLTVFTELIENLNTKYILLSYNNEGLMDSKTIINVLEKKGKTTLYKYKYKKFKSQKAQINDYVYEYLYLCEVGIEGKYKSYRVVEENNNNKNDNKD